MGDLEQLRREVRVLRRMVYLLGTCAVALASATVASCAHRPEPMTKIALVDGTHTVTIEATGIQVSDGEHHLSLLPGVVGLTDELQVFSGGGSVDITSNQVRIHDEESLASLAVHAAVGPELQLTNGTETSLDAHAGSGFAGVAAETGKRRIAIEANPDLAVVSVETRGGPRSSISTTNDAACASLARNRLGRAETGDTVQMCAPPAK